MNNEDEWEEPKRPRKHRPPPPFSVGEIVLIDGLVAAEFRGSDGGEAVVVYSGRFVRVELVRLKKGVA